jgi:hypothetical protein
MPMLVVVLAIGVVLILVEGEDEGRGWVTYTNERFRYEVSHPPDWHIDIHDPQPTDGFLTQGIRIEGKDAAALVWINFQGGWCETGPMAREQISVSEVSGTEDECPLMLVRHFPDFDGLPYTAMANWFVEGEDGEVAREIVRSFRFR